MSLQALLAAGVDAAAADAKGLTAAHIAARGNPTRVLGALFVAGAKGDGPDRDGRTPAWHAAAGGHAATIDFLRRPREACAAAAREAAVFAEGCRVRLRVVAPAEAERLQRGHGGWASDMAALLGTLGTVESVDSNGDLRIGGAFLLVRTGQTRR